MLPDLVDGLLPPGIHQAEWTEVLVRFGTNRHRRWLLEGLRAALAELSRAGCRTVYLDGSFVTDKPFPNDYDLCWEIDGVDIHRLDRVFLDLNPPRIGQYAKYRGDLLPNHRERSSRLHFVEFFQVDRETGGWKGIIALDPRR